MRKRMVETAKVTLIIGGGIIAIVMCAIGCTWLMLSQI
jgi:hypothetical protein